MITLLTRNFYWLLNMSVSASVAGLIVLALTRIRPIPRRWTVWLWLIPLARMWIPMGLRSRYSLTAILSELLRFSIAKSVPIPAGSELTFQMNYTRAAVEYFPLAFRIRALERIFTVAGIVWAAVAILLVTVAVAAYIRTLRRLRDAIHLRDNIWLSDRLDGPAVYGILHPRIILP